MPGHRIKAGGIYVQTNVKGVAKYIKISNAKGTGGNGAIYHWHPFQDNREVGLVSPEFIRPLTPEEKLEYSALTL